MAARNASEKEAVRFAIGGIVTADDIALRINPVAFAGIRSGNWNVHSDERAIALNKTVLIAVLVEVETDKVSLRVDAGDPRERSVGNVDCGELAVRQQKTVELITAVDVSAYNSGAVEGHGGKSAHCARHIDEGERIVAEHIAAPLKEVVAKKHADDVSAVAEAKPGDEGQSGDWRVNGFEGAAAQNISVAAARVIETAHKIPASINPGNVREGCAGPIHGRVHAVAQRKAVLYAVGTDVTADNQA
jgi:hypothetical protein